MLEIVLNSITFFAGLCIGSFLNVVILRLPEGKDIALDRSECRSCKNKLKWYHNIPVFSFIALRGRCAFCACKISLQYPLIELIHGLLALYLLNSWWNIPQNELVDKVCTFTIVSIFIAHFIIDLRYKLLLDKLNIVLLILVMIKVMLAQNYLPAIIGGAAGFLLPLTVTFIFYQLRGKIGLGGGDIKLFGILGLLFGIKGVFLNLFTSCLLGSFITLALIAFKKVNSDQYIPFGPYIIAVALVQILLPEYFDLWQNLLIPYY